MRTNGCKLKTHMGQAYRGLLSVGVLVTLALPSPASASGIDKKVSDVCKTSKSEAFRAKYCSAAKDYKKGYVANLASSAIWGGVTTVCGLSCSTVIQGGGLTCKIASTGGSAGEGILTKKFTDALKTEGMKYGGEAANKSAKASDGATAAQAADGKVNGDACTVAGTSALKGYEKLSNSKQNEKSIGQLRDQTKGMNSDPKSSTFFGGDANKGPAKMAGDEGQAITSQSEVCSEEALKTARGTIRCATEMDPTLPPYVKTEDFLKDIQKASGKSADDFFAGYESPGKSLMEAPGMASMPDAQKKDVAESLNTLDKYSAMKVAGKFGAGSTDSYADTDHKSKSTTKEDEFDVNGAIANALGQLKGEAEEKAVDDGVNSMNLGANRMPAETVSPEDRTISIFSRVEWRYRAVSARDHLGVGK